MFINCVSGIKKFTKSSRLVSGTARKSRTSHSMFMNPQPMSKNTVCLRLWTPLHLEPGIGIRPPPMRRSGVSALSRKIRGYHRMPPTGVTRLHVQENASQETAPDPTPALSFCEGNRTDRILLRFLIFKKTPTDQVFGFSNGSRKHRPTGF